MNLIAKGAEAELFLDGKIIVKNRIAKSYRIKDLDIFLRKSRTKREAKILSKLNIAAPELIKVSDSSIEMSYVEGEKVRDILDKNLSICKEIGQKIAKLHNQGIIHGDLTTSNMIYNNEVYIIDFGLSFFSHKIEDKAVDLHLLRQALESKHYDFRISTHHFLLKLLG